MNLEKVKHLLKKVNALLENLDDQGNTSAIERDLLLSYLRGLYDNVNDPVSSNPAAMIDDAFAASPIEEQRVVVEATDTARPTIVKESQTTFYDVPAQIEKHVEAIEQAAPVKQPDEAVINNFENPVQYFPPAMESESSAPVTKESSEPVFQNSATAPVNNADKAGSEVEKPVPDSDIAILEGAPGRFDSVFTEKSANDLADKYQLQKVVTIEGAMGINERMLVINELFGGDHNAFTKTVSHIDALSDFDSARQYLCEGAATEYKWDGN